MDLGPRRSGTCFACDRPGQHGGSASGATDKTWFLWDVYKTHFMAADGRIVDWNSEERTTSEGEAYALFFSLVANDRASFALILNWSQNNLAKGSLQENLPSWLWKRNFGRGWEWGVADENSASDADLWMAYTLIQAGRLWQEPSYTALGRTIAQHIADDEVVALRGNGLLLLPGRKGFHTADVYFANPSYEPLQILAALGVEFPDGPWKSLTDSEPDLVSAKKLGMDSQWIGCDLSPARDFPQWPDLPFEALASAAMTQFACISGQACWTRMRRAATSCS